MLDAATTRRLAIWLLSASGALLISAFNMIAIGIAAEKLEFADKVSDALPVLMASAFAGLASLIFAELAEHPKTPERGHPHSKINYLQSAFAMITIFGLGGLCVGGILLIVSATVVAG